MAYQGRYNNNNGKKSKSSGGVGKIVLIVVLSVVLILALLVGVAFYFVNSYLNSKLDKVTQAQFVEQDVSGQDLSALIGNLDETDPTELVTEATTEATTEPTTEATTEPTEPDDGQSGKIVNILLIGQDGREGEEALLSDAIILFTLNKETKTLRMTSFLRDSYVKLPEYYRGHTCGWNRINTSYALGFSWYSTAGAMEMLNLTLENNYGVKVDGNVEVSFDTFQHVVDAMGGVDIDLRGDELAKMLEYQGYRNAHFEYVGIEKRFDLQEGVNTLDGYLALAYARERHMSNADSDIQRTARQRKVIESLLNKLSKMSLSQINSLIDQVLAEIVTDISTDDMKMYITELVPYVFDLKLESYQVPAEGTYWGEMVELPDGLSGVLKIDFPKNKQVVAAIQSGEEVPTFK